MHKQKDKRQDGETRSIGRSITVQKKKPGQQCSGNRNLYITQETIGLAQAAAGVLLPHKEKRFKDESSNNRKFKRRRRKKHDSD